MKDQPAYPRFTFSINAEIRPAREEDLVAMEWLGLYSAHREIIRAAYAAQERGEALLLIAVSSDFPVAQVWVDLKRAADRGAALVWAVRTFYPLQGHGIGRRMMETAEREIRRRGFERAELGVEKSNKRALRFYLRLGWRTAGERVEKFEVTGSDGRPQTLALDLSIMSKEL